MSQQIIQALNAKYVAQKLEAIANLQPYLTTPVGIGEHPDIVSECAKLLEQISSATGHISTLQSLLQEKEKSE